MSDRYIFIQSWQDPGSGKVFEPGNVFRTAPHIGQELISLGVAQQVADYTLCRHNPLLAGGCVTVSAEQLNSITEALTASKNKTLSEPIEEEEDETELLTN